MKSALTAAILVLLILLGCGNGLCAETKNGPAAAGGFAIEQDGDRDEELPDDPLSFQPENGRGEGSAEEGLLPGADVLSDRARRVFEALRDALHKSDSPDDLDIPVVINDAVDRHIRCFTGPKREIFARWLVRSEKYAPTIREILRTNGLPEDLVYLSMIESGFNMKARSRANASGPWQFMNETGKQYGLRVDYWVDERYDLEKSTVAAARYLKSLFDQFGCWYLVAASYNAGENRVKRAMERQETKDFWKLREYKTLPKETQEYVPELIAAALIAKDPAKYGFDDTESTPVHTLTRIAVPGGMPIRGIAHALSLDVADLRALNPEILRGITPPDRETYEIKLPGTPEVNMVSRRLEATLAKDRRVVDVVRYCMRKKESLAAILKRYDVSRSDLKLVNSECLQAKRGRVIYIPRFASAKWDGAAASEGSKVFAENRLTVRERHDSTASNEDEEDGLVVLKSSTRSHKIHAPEARLAAHTLRKPVKGNAKRSHAKITSRTARRSSR